MLTLCKLFLVKKLPIFSLMLPQFHQGSRTMVLQIALLSKKNRVFEVVANLV